MTYRGNVAGVNYYVGGTFTFARNESWWTMEEQPS